MFLLAFRPKFRSGRCRCRQEQRTIRQHDRRRNDRQNQQHDQRDQRCDNAARHDCRGLLEMSAQLPVNLQRMRKPESRIQTTRRSLKLRIPNAKTLTPVCDGGRIQHRHEDPSNLRSVRRNRSYGTHREASPTSTNLRLSKTYRQGRSYPFRRSSWLNATCRVSWVGLNSLGSRRADVQRIHRIQRRRVRAV